MANMNDFEVLDKELDGSVNLDELESKLYDDLDENLANDIKELSMLKENKKLIGNPKALGDVVKNVIWEQFQNQIGVQAGEKFIEENRGLKLDLRNEAHIQTAENFADGKIATHNYKSREQLEQNYDRYKNKPHKEFRDEYIDPGMDATLKRSGELYEEGVDTVTDIYSGRQIPTKTKLENGKNNPDAAQREHVEPSAKLYNDPSLQMANNDEELAAVINDPENLQGYTTAKRNNRKSDKSADEMDKQDKNKHWEKANERAENFINKKKAEGEERLKNEGKKTQREEAFRIGKNTAKAVVMELLSDFLKEVISKLIKWFKSSNKKLKTLIESIKDAIHSFIKSLRRKLINVGSTVGATIATALVGPVVGMIKKAWLFLKQGWNSLKEAIRYLRSPEAKNKPFDIVMLNVGKIVISALTAGGAIILGEVIEKGLMSIPVFNIQIPLLGSLANVLGLFLGAIVAGVVGAIALNLIDKIIAKKEKTMLQIKIAAKTDVVLKGQIVKTYETIERACNAVGAVSQKTVDVLQDSYEKERSSLSDLKKQCEKGELAYRELEAVLGRKHS